MFTTLDICWLLGWLGAVALYQTRTMNSLADLQDVPNDRSAEPPFILLTIPNNTINNK